MGVTVVGKAISSFSNLAGWFSFFISSLKTYEIAQAKLQPEVMHAHSPWLLGMLSQPAVIAGIQKMLALCTAMANLQR